ncbi:MAG: helix-turn-helix domain-containing protein [Acidobacteria bacterium]|nr:helix-turn-helix domain-containing protein [Acidobacteriota bacterium]
MSPNSPSGERLDSWKEIAAYLDRDMSTVRRWEQREGLPVHRHGHHKLATVYAHRSEIDAWLENRSRVLGNDKPGWVRFFSENKKTVAGVAGGVTLLLLVGLVALMETGSSPKREALDLQQSDWAQGYQLIRLDGDLDRARPYIMRAFDLINPEDVEKGPRASLWLMLFPAYDALLAGDPETALFEAKSRLWDTLEGEVPIPRAIARSMLGALHLAVGQIDTSRQCV